MFEFEVVSLNASMARKLQEKYVIKELVGYGTYGQVYKGKIKNTQELVALKHLTYIQKQSSQGIPITSIRQIVLLQNLNHPNILKINEVVYDKQKHSIPDIYLCFNYMEHDFYGIICNKQKITFTVDVISYIIREVMKGLQYLHENGIIHRDIKSANILVNKKGQIKIADFGLAKYIKGVKLKTIKVVTLWYRAPEIFLGNRQYDYKIDIWSLGCFMSQLLLGQPLFKEKSEFDMVQSIFDICGTPNNNSWDVQSQNYKFAKDLVPKESKLNNLVLYLKQKLPEYSNQSEMLDLISKLLSINPNQRYNATQALEHPFINTQKNVNQFFFDLQHQYHGQIIKPINHHEQPIKRQAQHHLQEKIKKKFKL